MIAETELQNEGINSTVKEKQKHPGLDYNCLFPLFILSFIFPPFAVVIYRFVCLCPFAVLQQISFIKKKGMLFITTLFSFKCFFVKELNEMQLRKKERKYLTISPFGPNRIR